MNDLESLSLPELIDRMADISMPEPVPFVPQTVGWFVLAAALLVALVYGGWLYWRRRGANRYRRRALEALSRIEARLVQTGHDEAFFRDLAELVRRTALAAFPRSDVASRFGEDWLAFLDRTLGEDDFSRGQGRLFATAPYGGAPNLSGEQTHALTALVRRWIESHRA